MSRQKPEPSVGALFLRSVGCAALFLSIAICAYVGLLIVGRVIGPQ